MSTKHTPGPWETTRQSGITYVWQAGTETAVAKVYADVNEDSEANARLIAAAPELLAFAQIVAGGGYDMADIMTEARALIAKATGETI